MQPFGTIRLHNMCARVEPSGRTRALFQTSRGGGFPTFPRSPAKPSHPHHADTGSVRLNVGGMSLEPRHPATSASLGHLLDHQLTPHRPQQQHRAFYRLPTNGEPLAVECEFIPGPMKALEYTHTLSPCHQSLLIHTAPMKALEGALCHPQSPNSHKRHLSFPTSRSLALIPWLPPPPRALCHMS